MIVFGCPITDGPAYTKYAEPGIELAKEPDSMVFAYHSSSSLLRTYNLYLDLAKKLDNVEALVLVHQDAELVDPDFCAKVRRALQDPDVALVGCGGALGVRSIAWWEGSATWASFSHRFHEMGGGEIHGFTWDVDNAPAWGMTGEVDTIDGFVIAMSPWAIENLRFDESLGKLHGYDLDLCLQARTAGKKVVTTDFRAIHHHSLDLVRDEEAWIAAQMRVAEKWEGHLSDAGADWKHRAWRAEAELEIMRIQLYLAKLYNDDVRFSKSWRLTEPLRRLARFVRRLRGREPEGGELGHDGRTFPPLPEPAEPSSNGGSAEPENAPTASS
jgi:GT2 family glycosyltransferase